MGWGDLGCEEVGTEVKRVETLAVQDEDAVFVDVGGSLGWALGRSWGWRSLGGG